MMAGSAYCLSRRPIFSVPSSVGIADLFEFVDGKVTNKIIGQKLTVVCPQNKFEKFMVKVNNRNGVLSNEEIENAGGSINIYFKNLKGKFL